MGHRRRERVAENRHSLFSADGPDGPVFIHRIGERQAEVMRKAGRLIRHNHAETGECVGYQLTVGPAPLGARPESKRHGDGESDPSSAVLSRAEIEVLTNGIKSRTANLPEWGRLQRLARGLREMDEVEAAQEKLKRFEPVLIW